MTEKHNYRFYRFLTREPLDQSAPSGDRVFEFTPAQNQYVHTEGIRSEIEFWMTKSTAWDFKLSDGFTGLSPQVGYTGPNGSNGLCQNPGSALYKRVSLQTNDVEICSTQDHAETDTLYRLTFVSKEDNENYNSPIKPYETNLDSYTSYDDPVAVQTSNTVLDVKDGILRQAREKHKNVVDILTQVATNVTKGSSVSSPTTILKVKLTSYLEPLFKSISDQPLPHSRYRLTYNFDSNFLNKMLFIPSGESVTSFVVKDFSLYVPMSEGSIPTSLTHRHSFITNWSQTLTYQSNIQFQIPTKNPKHLIVAFQRNDITNVDVLSNMFEGPFSPVTDGNELTRIDVSYGGKLHTNNFPRDDVIAYNNYVNVTESMETGSQAMLSYKEWVQQPIFIYNLEQPPGSSNNIVTIDFTSGLENETIKFKVHVMCLYEKELSIEYDESSQVVQTTEAIIN